MSQSDHEVKNAVEVAKVKFGGINLAVNCAGIGIANQENSHKERTCKHANAIAIRPEILQQEGARRQVETVFGKGRNIKNQPILFVMLHLV